MSQSRSCVPITHLSGSSMGRGDPPPPSSSMAAAGGRAATEVIRAGELSLPSSAAALGKVAPASCLVELALKV